MRRQLVARLFQSLIVVAVVTTISFFVIRAAPGDPFSYESSRVTEATRQRLRQQFGYDQPVVVQFVRYVGNAVRGNFGYSIGKQQNVSAVLAQAVPRTVLLAGTALVLTFLIGVGVGVQQAVRRGKRFDRVSSGVLLFLYSLPDFWGAMMILLIFSYWLPIFPVGGIVHPVMYDFLSPWGKFVDRLHHLVLPVVALTLLTLAGVARHQRAAMLEILPSDFVRSARAKGLPERMIIWKHALRAGLTPMVVLLGLMLPGFLGGAVFVERVFGWPGLGTVAADAIASRDYDVVTASVIVGAVLVVVGNLLADLLQLAIDPRIRE